MDNRTVNRTAYRLFGRFFTGNEKYRHLEPLLIKARISLPYDIYLSTSLLISIAVTILLGLAGFIFLMQKGTFAGMPEDPGYIIYPAGLLVIVLLALTVFSVASIVPKYIADMRREKIDIMLPHSVAMMHALSRGDSNILGFFEVLAKNGKLYGEVSKEVDMILKDVKIFNYTLKEAIESACKNTPSDNFKNLLESMHTVVTGGGDLSAFFASRSEQYRKIAIMRNKAFLETIGTLSEVYITAFAAGPLFIICLLVVLGMVGESNYSMLLMIIYVIIPGSAIAFTLLMSIINKDGMSQLLTIKTTVCDFTRYVPSVGDIEESDANVIKKARSRYLRHKFLHDPVEALINRPGLLLYMFVPVAVIFFAANTFTFFQTVSNFNELVYLIDDYIVFAVLIAVIPFCVFVEIQFWRYRKIGDIFPEFLNRLTSLHDSGLTISRSIEILRDSDLGNLNKEIKNIDADIKWNQDINGALERFSQRVKTVSIVRVVALINSAIKTTGNIKATLGIATDDAVISKSLEKERRSDMKLHVMIIYAAFFIFLYVAYILVTDFLPQVPDISDTTISEMVGPAIAFSGYDSMLYTRIFFHAALIQGSFTGLVAGQIGEGNIRLGVKHSVIMIISAYVLFVFMI